MMPPSYLDGPQVSASPDPIPLLPISTLANRALSPSLSPSLGSSHGAFELKFVVADEIARTIQDWARQHLDPDPHAGGEVQDGYHVHSLYLDTPNFDTYHRSPSFRSRKFRLRRYGHEALVWLEQKRKRGGQVRKRRVCVAETELTELLLQTAEREWPGTWFQRRLQTRQLQPVCQVTYRRVARIGTSTTGPIRLTIDSHLAAAPATGWQVPSNTQLGDPLLDGCQIVELKFREVLPASFRGLIQDLRLHPGSFSKYRESVAACVPLTELTGECA